MTQSMYDDDNRKTLLKSTVSYLNTINRRKRWRLKFEKKR